MYYWILSSALDPECPLPEIQAVQRLVTDVAASDDRLLYLGCTRLTVSFSDVRIAGHVRQLMLTSSCILESFLTWGTGEDRVVW